MTRRDDPHERIKELGDASVPFTFDVHGLMESDNARKLEADLHDFFKEKRVNLINKRKEFFKVTMHEIEEACSKLNVTVKLTRLAEAYEFRESIRLTDSLVSKNG